MSTYFTIWHYLAVIVSFLLFLAAVIASFAEERANVRNSMIFSAFIVAVVIAIFAILGLDKYTKIAEVYNFENHRNLQTEQIIFTGIVKNTGNYTIGEVKLELKLVNKGHVSGNVRAGTFFKPSGFGDFFSSSAEKYQPQTIIETPIIATNLQPGESRRFRIPLKYPPYFKGVTFFTRTFAH